MTEEHPEKKKASRFGSIAAQTGSLKIGGKSKQESSSKTPSVTHVPRAQPSLPIDPHEPRKQQTAYLPISLQKWLRVRAPLEERDISDIVTEALLAYRERVEREESKE